MQITHAELLQLVLLAGCAFTIVLSVALVLLYWKSTRLAHVVPLAVSYCWIVVICALRAWHLIELEAALWNAAGALVVGDIGLVVLLGTLGHRDR